MMKNQLKKTSSDASRHEEVIKTKNSFFNVDFNQVTIEGFNTEQEYSPFRSTNSQQTYDQELDSYYNRGNYLNYNRRNNISRHYQRQRKVRSTQNNMKKCNKSNNEKIHRIETALS